jgi:hypothetical protein
MINKDFVMLSLPKPCRGTVSEKLSLRHAQVTWFLEKPFRLHNLLMATAFKVPEINKLLKV